MSNPSETQAIIDAAIFSEKFAILCDLSRRHFTDATIAAYYSQLTGSRMLKVLRNPITTEEFIEIADSFFCKAHFPSVDDFITETIELRKTQIQQPEELPPLMTELSEAEQAELKTTIAKARNMVQRATGKIGLAMPIPTAEERKADKSLPIDRLRDWFHNPASRSIALTEAMNREDVEIVTDGEGNAIDLRLKSDRKNAA